MFFKILCIYLFISSSKIIGNNGPFPLLMNYALPIASLDLIECIYCLNDPFLKNVHITIMYSVKIALA